MKKAKFSLIYVYDPLCGWCYGFSPVMKQIYDKYQNEFDFEVISGGMILGDRQGPIGDMKELIKSHYPRIEQTAGVIFGQPYLDVLEIGEQYQSSEKPSIALAVFKSYFPDRAILFAKDMQEALYQDGKDLNDDQTYLPLAAAYHINADEFLQKLNSEEFKQTAYYDFALAKQLQVTGYPAAFIKTSDNNFHMIAKGYADIETMELRIENVLKQITP